MARGMMTAEAPAATREQVARAARSLFAPCAVAAAVAHVVSVALASWLTREAYPFSHAISELGMRGRPYAALANLGAMVAPGVLVAFAAWTAARALPVPPRARFGLRVLLLAGICLIVAGAVPFPDWQHLAAALLGAAAGAVALATFAPWAARRLGRRVWLVTALACAALLGTDATIWLVSQARGIALHDWMGLEQRLASALAFAWWAACFFALARRSA